MKRKMKKKREGVAAKPRRQGGGEGGEKKREKEKGEKRKKKKKRNAGSSPATSAALQAAPARETTFRIWSAGWRGGSRTEEVNGVGRETGRNLEEEVKKRCWKWKKGRRVEAGRMSAIEKREREKEG